MLAEFIHTGILEMYHGLMEKKYCQKVQHYSYDGMRARTQLAVLDHNHNVGRSQGQTEEGAKKPQICLLQGKCRVGCKAAIRGKIVRIFK